MSLFDAVVSEANEKFNLGGRASVLLSVLTAKITDKSGGGLGGFLGRFNTAGLSAVASSWVSSGTSTSISSAQLESALGRAALEEVADQSGLDYQTATAAAAFMIPHVVDNLTLEGVLSDVNSVAGVDAGNAFDRIGTSAADVIDADRASASNRFGDANSAPTIAERADASVENNNDYAANDNSPLKWLMPLVILALMILLGYSFCGKTEEHKTAKINVVSAQI